MPVKKEEIDLFTKLKNDLVSTVDPVAFCQKYMTLDGDPFRLMGNGYKPFADLYRYIGVKALEPNAKPMILVKGRQVAGTTMASMLTAYFMTCGLFGANGKPPIRIFHTFPHLDMAASYSKTKFNALVSSSVSVEDPLIKKTNKPKSFMQNLLDTSTATNDSLHFKQFKGGNHVWLESTGLTGDRLRGRSGDVLLVDEVQDTTTEAIGTITKMMTTAKYGKVGQGVQVYFGTPRGKGSDFHKMWQASSQQFYHLKCEKCEDYFPLYTPESDDWEKIWLYDFIVKCTKCGHEQDKRVAAENGKWVATKDENDESCQMVGFFINQLFMPIFKKEDILSQKPGVHPTNTERIFKNEVLGEFFQGDSSPITTEDIRNKCGDVGRKMVKSIPSEQKKMVVLGIDYGKKADIEQLANSNGIKNVGSSFSVGVVLEVKGPGLLSIERAIKFKKNDLESKKGLVDQIMRDYSVQLAVGDIGFAQDISEILHVAHGDRYLASRVQSKINDPKKIRFSNEAFPKEIQFEKDYFIGEILDKMKKGEIRFPLGDFEKTAWLIDHCASMELKPSISRNGEPTVHYVKGSGPNDGLMALLNAYLAYKFLITKGFTTNNPIVQEQNFNDFLPFKNKPLINLANVKRHF